MNEESERIVLTFMSVLGLNRAAASAMVESGVTSLEEVAYVPVEELLEIEGLDDELVKRMRTTAREILSPNS